MKRIKLFLLVFTAYAQLSEAQELFPNSEPASIIPKNTLGIRLMNEAYNNSGKLRSWNGAMFMYGISSKLMLNAMLTGSNHHSSKLSESFISKNEDGNEIVKASPSTRSYDYLFESLNLGFRYRFVNIDGDHRHFRMAFYGNGVYALQPHDEAEVTLMGDNKAIGGGLISTVLLHKLAISASGGIIKPFLYNEAGSNISLVHSSGYNYALSFGYLVFPFRYKNYKQVNVNLYGEFVGKTYGELRVTKNGMNIPMENNNAFREGNYLEFRPALQFIVKSNLRIDLATSFALVNKSYIRKYPLYQLNFQYYFFL